MLKDKSIYVIAVAVVLLAGCTGRYVGVPSDRVLAYQTRPTYGSLYELAHAYAEAINSAVAEDTLHPGMLADYGVALALMGHDGEACRMLNAEARAFPQSSRMVARIKERLLPGMVEDTTVNGTVGVDMGKLDGWAYDSIAALMPLPRIVSVVDSTDSVRVTQQTPTDSVEYPIRLTANQKRELLAAEQEKAEKRRQFVADSIAAAKQAVIDARKQAQIDRRNAKKEKQRLKEEMDKQRKKEAKEKALQREKEKQQRDAERRERNKKKKGGAK